MLIKIFGIQCQGKPQNQHISLNLDASRELLFKDILIIDLEICKHCKAERKNRVFDNLCADLNFMFIAYMGWKLLGTRPTLSQMKTLTIRCEQDEEFKNKFNDILLSQIPIFNKETQMKFKSLEDYF
jgi:hypothetical protein